MITIKSQWPFSSRIDGEDPYRSFQIPEDLSSLRESSYKIRIDPTKFRHFPTDSKSKTLKILYKNPFRSWLENPSKSSKISIDPAKSNQFWDPEPWKSLNNPPILTLVSLHVPKILPNLYRSLEVTQISPGSFAPRKILKKSRSLHLVQEESLSILTKPIDPAQFKDFLDPKPSKSFKNPDPWEIPPPGSSFPTQQLDQDRKDRR